MRKLNYLNIMLITILLYSCGPDETGCMDENAINYNIDAVEDDGSCEYDLFVGPDVITVDPVKINRKILVIGIDGFRSDVLTSQITPFMHNMTLARNGYYNTAHIAEDITYSGPNWSSILTGVHQYKHNVLNNEFENDNYSTYPHFFKYIENAQSSIKTASIVNWIPINTYVLNQNIDYSPVQPINDATVLSEAQNILSNSNADVLFLQFDELDVVGHAHGFNSNVNEYADMANLIDSHVENLFEIIDNKRLQGEDWLILIVSDHGGEGTSHSDGNDPNVNQTIFFAEHSDIEFQASCCYVSTQADIASTVLNFLGISSQEYNFNTDGQSVVL